MSAITPTLYGSPTSLTEMSQCHPFEVLALVLPHLRCKTHHRLRRWPRREGRAPSALEPEGLCWQGQRAPRRVRRGLLPPAPETP
jgi:hypothetical protein